MSFIRKLKRKGDSCINISNIKLNTYALLITIFLFTFIYSIKAQAVQILQPINNKEEISVCNTIERKCNAEENFTNENWILEIPKIELKASINYGTTKDVMDKYIGHFDETKLWIGNVGLAAHNRGYPVNYFGRLKELQAGDEIKYTTIYGTKTYKAQTITIISDTDWSYLEETKDNRITLITCVENQPNYRRCIQGIEI